MSKFSGLTNILIERPFWLELIFLTGGIVLSYIFVNHFDLTISNQQSLFSSMVGVSVGLMGVSVIVINLTAAVTVRTERMAQSVWPLVNSSFVCLISLFLSVLVGIFLISFGDQIPRIFRYKLCLVWASLVLSAMVRTIALGRRILIANLTSNNS